MAIFISGDGLESEPNINARTILLQSLVNQAVNQRLPLLLRGQIFINKTIRIRGDDVGNPATYFGNLHIDGGNPGETTLFFDTNFNVGDTSGTANTMFATDDKLRVAEYIKFTGIKFSSPATHKNRSAIYLPNANFADVEVSNCWFNNCSLDILLGRGYYSRSGVLFQAGHAEDAIVNMTRVKGNRFTSDDSGVENSPFNFRNGNYRDLNGDSPPPEPRTDRQPGFYFSENHFDVFMITSENINIALIGYGLPEAMKIIGNTFKQRNVATFADVDLALGSHRAIFANNTLYNCGLVMKGTKIERRGYDKASTHEDKIISANNFIFDKNFNHTYAMNLIGGYWNVVGNIIRAPRLDAKTEFGAINFPSTDEYFVHPGLEVVDPFYAVIANNLVNVRIDSVKLPNNPIKGNLNVFTVRFSSNHSLSVGDWIKFNEGASYGGVQLDPPFQVVSVPSTTTITINAPAATAATVDGGGGNISVIYGGPQIIKDGEIQPPPSVAPLNLKRNPMVRQAVISGNLLIGGNYSGLPKGASTVKQVVCGNMWAFSDFLTAGDLHMVNKAAAANSAVTIDGSYFQRLAYGLRAESNSISPQYHETGADTGGITINAVYGSYFEVNTQSISVSVNGIINGDIGDTIMIKRKQGTTNAVTIVNGPNFRTKNGSNLILNTDMEYVIMRKVTVAAWIEEAGYYA